MSKFTIVICFTPNNKYLPKGKARVITPNHVNTGSVYNNKIVLYRKEEVLKVLIHELVHLVNDNHNINNIFHPQFASRFCFDRINDADYTLPSETLTEIMASMLNIIFVLGDCKLSKDVFMKSFYEMLRYEIGFGLFQTAKILNYFGFKQYSDFFKKGRCNVKFITINISCILLYNKVGYNKV